MRQSSSNGIISLDKSFTAKLFFLLLFSFVFLNAYASPYLRDELNLVEKGAWQDAVGDTLYLREIPANLKWESTEFPTKKHLGKILQSVDRKWAYSTPAPGTYFNPDGSLKIKEKLSMWYRRTFDIPADMLKNKTVHLVLGGASYKSGVIVNGQFAGSSYTNNLPLDFDVTKFVKPGKNSIVIAITTREGLLDPKHQVYLAPSNGGQLGVRGPVRLEFRPETAVEDVFVKTSVKDKNIEFEVTISNSSNTAETIVPEIKIRSRRDMKQVNAVFKGKAVTVPAGQTVVTQIRENWVAPILWSTTTPEMYVADVSLESGGKVIDNYKQHFGFRDFTIKGKDFLLNGKRIVLLRKSTLWGLTTQEHNQQAAADLLDGRAEINSIRQHLGTNNQDMIYRANQTGVLLTPESAYSWKKCFPMNKSQYWLPGVTDNLKKWVRHLRNEPAVVIYNLTNETYWESTDPHDMEVTKKIVDAVRSVDSTRPLEGDGDNGWGSNLDIINIHYPEGQAGTLRLKYTNSGTIIPNDLFWLKPEGGNGWRTKFKWDRPLFVGEFGMGSVGDRKSAYMGDDFYNWIKWEMQAMAERNDGSSYKSADNPAMEAMKKRIIHLRDAGVAGLNPWTGYYPHVMRKIEIAPLEYYANVPAGGKFTRKIAVFNDGNGGHSIQIIRYYLVMDGDIVVNKSIKTFVAQGSKRNFTIEFTVPQTNKIKKAELVVRALRMRGRLEVDMAQYAENINIIPTPDLAMLKKEIIVCDPHNSIKSELDAMKLTGVDKLTDSVIPAGKKLLIVGKDAYKSSMNNMLDKFVEAGNVVLMLAQKNWKPYRTELPERDPLHAATQSWLRRPGHPVVKGLDESFVSFWHDDNVVSYETFIKPNVGNITAILDCGGLFGMHWSPLLEVPLGKGAMLMTTLDFDKTDAAAGMLLGKLIEYGCERSPRTGTALNLLAGNNQDLKEYLRMCGVVMNDGIGQNGPILVDASADFKVSDLKKALDDGRTVWLHNFTPKTLGKVVSLLPDGAKLEKVPRTVLGAMPVSNDKLIAGLSNFDFAWYRRQWSSPESLFKGATPVTKPGDWILDTEFYNGKAEKLVSPAFMTKINAGKGTILFDTLAWDKAIAKEPQKALRIASALLTNLGCQFRFKPKQNYSYGYVDLRKFANMEYIDRVKGDGVGGWTDDGRADMRFFLINHVGTGNGELDGMAVDVDKFPEDIRFNDVPFHLIDPKKNHDKSVLSFGSNKIPAIKMRSAGPIPVNQKADILWLLHATAWGGSNMKAAQYEITYADGSKTGFTVINGRDVGDWFDAKPYPNCKIAWTGKNLITSSTGIYMSPWENPYPDKVIKSIEVKAGLTNCAYILVAITTAQKETAASGSGNGIAKGETLVAFDFSKNPTSKLNAVNKKERAEITTDGAKMAKGTHLVYFPGKEIKKALYEPFGVELDFTPQDKPDGYCAGLLETGPFRITLKKNDLKLVVESFDKNGKRLYCATKDKLQLNRRYKFDIIVNGNNIMIYCNGKLNTVCKAPLPNKDIGVLRFGKAGGKDYNFNGIFHKAEIYKLK